MAKCWVMEKDVALTHGQPCHIGLGSRLAASPKVSKGEGECAGLRKRRSKRTAFSTSSHLTIITAVKTPYLTVHYSDH